MQDLMKQGLPLNESRVNFFTKSNNKYRTIILKVLEQLDGARLDIIEDEHVMTFGDHNSLLHGEIIVHDVGFYKSIVNTGSIGAAEAYIDGMWTSPNLTRVIEVMARNQTQLDKIENKVQWVNKFKNRFLLRQNANTEQGSKRNILAHYDLGNELYSRFLDSSMQYSCAVYSPNATTLASAQQNKMHTICEALELNEHDRVIEVGTGWGGLAIYMAQNYGCHITTTTISDAQYEYASEEIDKLGLSDKITLLKQDYRLLKGQYDKLVSIEMIEAVGHEYLATFFAKCSSLLKPDGKMLIQSITISDGRYDQYRQGVDFIQKYIFPGGCLPSIAVMSEKMASNTDLVVCDIQDIGLHYARTISEWRNGFERNWSQLNTLGYDEEFKRLWLFYLSYCEGAFIQRVISTHHIVARKPRYRGKEDAFILDY